MRIVIAGVSGSGKTTIGTRLAQRLGYEFADADAFHPPENVAKMHAGIPLEDADRQSWLEALGKFLAGKPEVVLACSALKRVYRDLLRARAGGEIRFFLLTADEATLHDRLSARTGHFMPASLLESQLNTLQVDEDVAVIPNLAEPDGVVSSIVTQLGV